MALITRYAVRFDPVDRITFYSGVVLQLNAGRRYRKELIFPLYIRGVISAEVDFDVDQRGWRRGSDCLMFPFGVLHGEATLATASVLG
jgi:hypothetical protein